jgi:hypothetical protein
MGRGRCERVAQMDRRGVQIGRCARMGGGTYRWACTDRGGTYRWARTGIGGAHG